MLPRDLREQRKEGLTWPDAGRACAGRGGRLALHHDGYALRHIRPSLTAFPAPLYVLLFFYPHSSFPLPFLPLPPFIYPLFLPSLTNSSPTEPSVQALTIYKRPSSPLAVVIHNPYQMLAALQANSQTLPDILIPLPPHLSRCYKADDCV